MAPTLEQSNRRPFGLVVSGEARRHEDALRKLLGPKMVVTFTATNAGEIVRIVQHGEADAAVVDAGDPHELLKTLRMIRRVNMALPVVLVAQEVSRRFLEDALRLAAFSIAHRPLEREELLMHLRRIFERMGSF